MQRLNILLLPYALFKLSPHVAINECQRLTGEAHPRHQHLVPVPTNYLAQFPEELVSLRGPELVAEQDDAVVDHQGLQGGHER
jgi:hypothetical protein